MLLNKQEILSKISTNSDSYLAYLAHGEFVGNNYLILNPHRKDKNLGSFLIDRATGKFIDFACTEAKGSNFIDLTMYLLCMDFYSALQYMNNYLTGESVKTTPVAKKPVETESKQYTYVSCTTPVPTNKYQGMDATATYVYTDTEGLPLVLVHRYDTDTGKVFIQQSHTQESGWVKKAMPGDRPLYNLQQLVADQHLPVLIVEGEKNADFLKERIKDVVVTTTSGGANAPLLTDLAPLYGREVYIWKDEDEAGEHYAQALITALHDKVKFIKVFSAKIYNNKLDYKSGYDAIDFYEQFNPRINTFEDISFRFRKIESVDAKVVLNLRDEQSELIYEKCFYKESNIEKNIQAQNIDEALDYGEYLCVNDNVKKRAIILNINPNSSAYATRKLQNLPKPNYFITNSFGAMQYVYLLKNPVFCSKNAQREPLQKYRKACYLLQKMAGYCHDGVMLTPVADIDHTLSNYMINLTSNNSDVIKYNVQPYSLSELLDTYKAIATENSADNTVFFEALRNISYRVVNYATDFSKELHRLAEKLVAEYNLKLTKTEFEKTLISIINFTKHNKCNMKNKKYTLSKSIDEIAFEKLNNKQRMSAGAIYTANSKRTRTHMKLLVAIKKHVKTASTTQKVIAEQMQMTSSNISKHYSTEYAVAKELQLQSIEQQQSLDELALINDEIADAIADESDETLEIDECLDIDW